MENQIVINNQSAQHVKQEGLNQPTSFSNKLRVNYWMVATFFLFILVISLAWLVFKLGGKDKKSSLGQVTVSKQATQFPTQTQQKVTKTMPMVLFVKRKISDYSKHQKNGSVTLSSLNVQTGEKKELIKVDGCYLVPSLSPDKTQIAYITMLNSECEKEYHANVGQTELWIYDFQSRTKLLVTNGVWKFTKPQWSSNGKYLAYDKVIDSRSSREHMLYIYNLSTKKEKLTTTLTSFSGELVSVSPNAKFLYFRRAFDLIKVNVQDGTQTEVFTNKDKAYDFSVYPSPNETKMIVFFTESWYGGKKTPINWKVGIINLVDNSYKELDSNLEEVPVIPFSVSDAQSNNNNPIVVSSSEVIYGVVKKDPGIWAINLTDGAKTRIKKMELGTQNISTLDISLDRRYLLYGNWEAENNSGSVKSHWRYYIMNLSNNSTQEINNFDYRTEKAIYLLN